MVWGGSCAMGGAAVVWCSSPLHCPRCRPLRLRAGRWGWRRERLRSSLQASAPQPKSSQPCGQRSHSMTMRTHEAKLLVVGGGGCWGCHRSTLARSFGCTHPPPPQPPTLARGPWRPISIHPSGPWQPRHRMHTLPAQRTCAWPRHDGRLSRGAPA